MYADIERENDVEELTFIECSHVDGVIDKALSNFMVRTDERKKLFFLASVCLHVCYVHNK